MKSTLLSILALSTALLSYGAAPLTLTFHRTGTDASGVEVNADIAGVSASLTSISHSLKTFGSESLCADANGSSSPTIVYTFSVNGLPADWSANQIGLDITAYNASGNLQVSNDGKDRHFNVTVQANNSQIASWLNLDPAAGIDGVRKVWEKAMNQELNPDTNLNLTITVTKGKTNVGCFFGLNSICLSTGDNIEPEPASTSKIYTIKWKNNTSNYMTAMPDGSIQIGGYAVSNRIFWEFIPTSKDNCYNIRNTATGMYIGSCNLAPSSNSRVQMSETPVEYYVNLSASTSGDNHGCYWLSSTDCDNYSNETSGARCLNKDGNSSYIITWTTGLSNTGSYWTLTESEDLYEVRPFSTGVPYYILNPQRKALNYSDQWVDYSQALQNAYWMFEGTSNTNGGYQIINALTEIAINNGARYKVIASGAGYSFVDSEGEHLSLGGQDEFTFDAVRTSFAKNNRIFQMPCGAIGDTWIASVNAGEFHYPMVTAANGSLVEGKVTNKPSKYEILTRDAIDAAPGSTINLNIALNKAPGDKYSLMAFADFNRDGIFEYSLPITIAQQTTAEIAVPADAKTGDCRLRLRLNSNAFSGPDDEVFGEILDLKLNIANPAENLIDPVARPNDSQRGDAQWANNIASATSKGNALFLYWNEGMRVVSAQPEFTVEPSNKPRILTAVFSANTDVLDGIAPVILNTVNSDATIVFNGVELSVEGAQSNALMLFDINGRLVADTSGEVMNISGLPGGIYIAKAITNSGIVSAKIVK